MPIKKLLSSDEHKKFISGKGYTIVIHMHEGDWPSQQMVERCAEYCRIYTFARFATIDTDIHSVSTGHIPIAYTPTVAFFKNGVPMGIQVAGTDYHEMERILNSMRVDGYAIADATNVQRLARIVTLPDNAPIMRIRATSSLHK